MEEKVGAVLRPFPYCRAGANDALKGAVALGRLYSVQTEVRVNVAILGASAKPDRYAFKAQERLVAAGHDVHGISPASLEIGIPVVGSVSALPQGIDTLTVYVGAKGTAEIQDQILGYGFKRVIFNPGAENPDLMAALLSKGVDAFEACTLVMLSTGQF
jgi:predicted CoA-binding protein